MSWKLERLVPVYAIAFAVLLVIGDFVLRGTRPDPNAPVGEIAAYFADHRHKILISVYILILANFLLLAFVGVLWRSLRLAEGAGAWLSLLAFGGGVLAAATSGLASAFWAAGAYRKDLEPNIAATLFDLGERFRVQWAGLAPMLMAAGAVILRTRVFPRWLAWLGLVSVALWIVAAYPSPNDANTSLNALDILGGVAVVACLVWMVVVSVIIARREGKSAAAPAPAPASR